MYLKTWFLCQLQKPLFVVHQLDIHPLSQILHGFPKHTIIHEFKEILFKLVVCLFSHTSVEIYVRF